MESSGNVLELSLPPQWDAVRDAWEACRGTLLRSSLSQDEVDALAMVAQELLENAVKYGAAETIRLSLRVDVEDVTVEVASRVDGDGANLRSFGGAVKRIREATDPFQGFVERLRQAATRPESGAPSELGLARIAYEGRCALDYRVDAGTLAVSAVYRRGGVGWEIR
jgi:hypothetical protein